MKIISFSTLIFLLLTSCVPTASSDQPGPTYIPTQGISSTVTSSPVISPTNSPTPLPSLTTLTFTAEADARVSQATPKWNYGFSTYLQVDEGSGSALNSYIRFSVSGISGAIQSTKLRVYCITNGTVNGPAVYLAPNNWIESGIGGITWNNQPGALSSTVDNKGAIATNSWVEYDVTPLVTGNGTYTFVLAADSSDGVTFSSREGGQPPQLVVQFGASALTTTRSSPTPPANQTIIPTTTAP